MSKQIPPDRKAEVVKLYKEGKSAREVASMMNPPLSHQTVLNICREAGIDVRPPHVNNLTTS